MSRKIVLITMIFASFSLFATVITDKPEALVNKEKAVFKFSGDKKAVFECKIDGDEWKKCSSGQSYTGLSEGKHLFAVREKSKEKDAQPTEPAEYSWVIDLTPPKTKIDTKVQVQTAATTASFDFDADGDIGGYQCRVDNSAWKNCTSGIVYDRLSEGQHVFEVKATDKAGNIETQPPSFKWSIDLTPPKTGISAKPAALSNSKTAEFEFTADDKEAVFECSIDGASWAQCKSPAVYKSLAEGTHKFAVKAADNLGNSEKKPQEYQWIIDITPPQTKITANPEKLSKTVVAVFSFECSKKEVLFECAIDSGAFEACKNGVKYSSLKDGTHSFVVKAKDKAGNVEKPGAAFEWIVDTVLPETKIALSPKPLSNSTTAIFRLSGSEPVKEYNCSLDNSVWKKCGDETEYNDLGEGKHSFAVKATDNAGNIEKEAKTFAWQIDLTPPETKITASPKVKSNSADANLVFKGSGDTDYYECSIDGGSWDRCVAPKVLLGLKEGGHGFTVRAIDKAGNVEKAPVEYKWAIDITPPVTVIKKNPEADAKNTSADFEFEANEESSYQCKLDSSEWKKCESPFNTASLKEGDHIFYVKAADMSGNNEQSAKSFKWRIDITSPDSFIETRQGALVNVQDAVFTFKSSEPDSLFYCDVDGSGWKKCENTLKLSALPEGVHKLNLKAVDKAGNEDKSPASFVWTIDITPPKTAITAKPKELVNTKSVEFKYESNEKDSKFECRLDTEKWAACSEKSVFPNLGEGQHQFFVKATDKSGNVEKSETSYKWMVDTILPETKFESKPAELGNITDAVFDLKCSEENCQFKCKVDGDEMKPCDKTVRYKNLKEGKHSFSVIATDRAGNTEKEAKTFLWQIDITPPETKILSGPKEKANAVEAQFNFKGSADTDYFECSFDGGSFEKCVSPKAFSGMKEGAHEFLVKATDKAGNIEKKPVDYKWSIDITPPVTTIRKTPAVDTREINTRFEFDASEEVSFQCKIDNGEWKKCTTPYDISGQKEGDHIFYVKAADMSGNNESSLKSYKWRIDTTPPDTSIESKPGELVNSPDANFSYKSTEPDSSFLCLLDNGEWKKCEPKYSTLTEGRHKLSVKAIDKAGNEDKSPASFSWMIDLTPPKTVITAKPKELVNTKQAEFKYESNEKESKFECRLDNEKWAACSDKSTFSNLGEGLHQFFVRATDKSGNTEKTEVVYKWMVDTIPPETKLVSKPSELGNSTGADFELKCSEDECSFKCKINDGEMKPCDKTLKYAGLKEGKQSFSVLATDKAGNIQKASLVYTWVIDITEPKTAIEKNPEKLTNKTAAVFKFSPSEEAAYFECALDSEDWKKCQSEKKYDTLKDGKHKFSVRAKDKAGNIESKPPVFEWEVDTVAPVTKIEAKPAELTNKRAAEFKMSASKTGSKFSCRLDLGQWEACESGKKYNELAPGKHVFGVKSADPAGNAEKKPLTYNWVIDIVPPETEIVATPEKLSNKDKAPFIFKSTKKDVSYECDLDGKGWKECSEKLEFGGLSEGDHKLMTRAVDPAGNIDESPASFEWKIDLTPPKTRINEAPPKYNIETFARFVFDSDDPEVKYSCKLDKAEWKACSSPAEFKEMKEGNHVFIVKTKDKSGNEDPEPKIHEWLIPFQFTAVSTGYQHTCSVGISKAAYCWGSNSTSQLGDKTTNDRSIPNEVESGKIKWDWIFSGKYHSCAVSAGKLYCWGSNGSGQLGCGSFESKTSPEPVKSSQNDWIYTSAGISHNCSIRADGGKNSLFCWGDNTAGQLGDGTTEKRNVPTPVKGKPNGWISIAAGFFHTCGIREENGGKALYCWGGGSDGQLGNGKDIKSQPELVEVSGGFKDWKSVTAGSFHTCGIRDEGGEDKAYCWGSNSSGQLGVEEKGQKRNIPTLVGGENKKWKKVNAGNMHTCGIKNDSTGNTAWCWGYNYYGQLGSGSSENSRIPVKVSGGFNDWEFISGGENHSCAIRHKSERYQLYCWGRNELGQLGDGTDDGKAKPSEVLGTEQKKEKKKAVQEKPEEEKKTIKPNLKF